MIGLEARFDPVRFRFIEAMARRAGALPPGEARRLLDERVAALIADYQEKSDREDADRATAPALTALKLQKPLEPRSPLAALVDRLAPQTAAQPELKALQHVRDTWTRLDADRRLTQSLAAVPGNAGPLNSHHLMHRALSEMRELSPAYLHRFMAYVDALFWLDQPAR